MFNSMVQAALTVKIVKITTVNNVFLISLGADVKIKLNTKVSIAKTEKALKVKGFMALKDYNMLNYNFPK